MTEIIDTHVHFWDSNNNINSWVKKNSKLPTTFSPIDLIKKYKSNLKGFIHIEAHDSNIPTSIEQQWLQTILEKYKMKTRTVAFLDITMDHKTFEENIIILKKYKLCIGIRHILTYHPHLEYSPNKIDLSKNKNILANLCLLSKNSLIFHLQCYPSQLNNLLPSISKSEVTCVIDHSGLPCSLSESDLSHWRKSMVKASLNKNIYIKLSLLSEIDFEKYIQHVIIPCIKIFTAKQCMYASNNPVAFIGAPTLWEQQILDLPISNSSKKNIFMNTAQELYKLY